MKTPFAFISSILLASLSVGLAGVAHAESLYPLDRTRNMISNKVASQRGDILTVVVNVSRSTSSSVNTQTQKESTINNQVNQFLFSAAASGFGTHNGELPATNITGNNEYQGGGTITSTATLADRFSVMISDVLPNGNLVIEGARRISDSGETQYVVLSGVVRYWDITGQNTIDSGLIHNANLEYISEGSITTAQRKGWLMRLNDLINPF